MNIVEPIRSKEDIELIKQHLLDEGHYRDYALFVVGINIGLTYVSQIYLS